MIEISMASKKLKALMASSIYQLSYTAVILIIVFYVIATLGESLFIQTVQA